LTGYGTSWQLSAKAYPDNVAFLSTLDQRDVPAAVPLRANLLKLHD